MPSGYSSKGTCWNFKKCALVCIYFSSSEICLNANAEHCCQQPHAKMRAVQRLSWFLHQDGMQIYETARTFKNEKNTKHGTRFLGHCVTPRKPQLLTLCFHCSPLDSPFRVSECVHVCTHRATRTCVLVYMHIYMCIEGLRVCPLTRTLEVTAL